MPQNKIISFSYVPYSIKDPNTGVYLGEIFRPIIAINISFGGVISHTFDALVDSGSDTNLFPARLGEYIGINFKNNFKIVYGIGGVKVKAYTKKIKLHLLNFSFDTEADFSYEQQIPLLGRNGFFTLFKSINFKEEERFLDIEFN